MMDSVGVLLEKHFHTLVTIPPSSSTQNYGGRHLQVLLKLLSSDQLVIEEFSPQVVLFTSRLYRLLLTTHPAASSSVEDGR